MTTAGEPGPQQTAPAGDANAQRGSGPNGGRAQEWRDVGENGVQRDGIDRIAISASQRRCHRLDDHSDSAAARMACGLACDSRLRKAREQGSWAFGSGHCLQSRISHDSFLVGYDWVD